MISHDQMLQMRLALRRRGAAVNTIGAFHHWRRDARHVEAYTHDLCHWTLLYPTHTPPIPRRLFECVQHEVAHLGPIANRDANEMNTIALEDLVLRAQFPVYDCRTLFEAGHRNTESLRYTVTPAFFASMVRTAQQRPEVRRAVPRVRAALQALIPNDKISWRPSRAKGA